MGTIHLRSGHNDCLWNIEGKCTCAKITKTKTSLARDWDSKQNCTLTQIEIFCCSEYRSEAGIYRRLFYLGIEIQ